MEKPGQNEETEKTVAEKEAEERFKQDLIARGEAVEVSADESLPFGATHVVTKDKKGKVKIERKRFSAF